MPKPKPKPGKGGKILCETLDFIANANVEIAMDEAEKGNAKGANDALAVAEEAGKDYGSGGAAKRRECANGLRGFLVNSSAVAQAVCSLAAGSRPGPKQRRYTVTRSRDCTGRCKGHNQDARHRDGRARAGIPITIIDQIFPERE